ncbi:MAG: NADPH:quinone reductase-like oxidoreductase [Akkermansiaceae bacterium]|nr:NADPH:quinone reductase-like oxidoreductase [Akkermansiaceae bacterium]
MVMEAGQAPVYGEFRDPVAASGQRLIRVTAAAISHVTKSRASGGHYSSEGELPFIPGVDGTGLTEHGRRVYFLLPEKPYGAMGELCCVDERRCIALPDGLGDESAAAMAIPAVSSWAALTERAHFQAGETVLINGATGASGRLAIQVARYLGAKKIIATGRQAGAFQDLRLLGADVTISLNQEPEALENAFKAEFREGIDVVLDYLWGVSAETLLIAGAKAGPEGVPIRYVQIGSASGADIRLPSAVLRSSSLQLMGSGIGSIPFPRLLAAVHAVLEVAPSAGFRIATEAVPLADVTRAWSSGVAGPRVVLVP